MSRLRAGLLGLVALALLSACAIDPYGLPLPGGADVGDHPMRLTIELRDALDLTKQGAVRVDDVSVGRIDDVRLKGWIAEVDVVVNGDVSLPANATATLRQSSLLGEKFLSLERPAKPEGRLSDGDRIPIERTGRNPELEEVLGAASLLFNGGGLDRTNTIVKELNNALDGNEPEVRQLLQTANDFLAQLDTRKGEIVATLEQVNRLTSSVNAQSDSIDAALASLPGALRVLEDQRDDLTSMLVSLDRLGDSTTGVLAEMRADTVANLQALEPILHHLTTAADDLSGNLSTLLTYPFPDVVVGGDVATASAPCDNADVVNSPISCMGDWFNLQINLDLGIDQLCSSLGLLCPIDGALTGSASAPGSDALVPLVEGLVPRDTGGSGLCAVLGTCRAPADSADDLSRLFGLEESR